MEELRATSNIGDRKKKNALPDKPKCLLKLFYFAESLQ